MLKNTGFLFAILTLLTPCIASAQENAPTQQEPLRVVAYEKEYSDVIIKPARVNNKEMIAVVFEGTHDMHYYADTETAVGGMALEISASYPNMIFGKAQFPSPSTFYDPALKQNVPVYVGNFNVYIPIEETSADITNAQINVKISGIACTSQICLRPFEYDLKTNVDISASSNWEVMPQHTKETQGKTKITTSKVEIQKTIIYLSLALVAGLTFNLMPCVLPIIPLIISRLLRQAQESRHRSITLGVGFCGGIVSFFLLFAAISIIFQTVTGQVFNWSDQFRYPAFVLGMSLFIIVFALFMFDIFTIAVPASIASKSGKGVGMGGSIGMGFFAALLSTPCTGALIGVVIVWVQTQTWLVALLTFTLMGLGMAIPYAILVGFPSLLNSLPKPGTWMELFRKTLGFILLFIAVKLIGSLGKERLVSTLYYVVILSFSVWMWGKWVTLSTPTGKKWIIRTIAVSLAVIFGFIFLPEKIEQLNWKSYDASVINNAKQIDQPILIKFTADWCANCVVVDNRVYKNSEVIKLIEEKNVLMIKADTTTTKMPATIDLREVYGEPGNVPVSIFIDKNGKEHKLRGIFPKEDLIAILKEVEN